jgi:hypothetical protein
MTTEDWYRSPTAMTELAALLKEGALKDAIEVLKEESRATSFNTNDLATISLRHASMAGYNKAINDLIALATPTKKISRNTPLEWEHIKPRQ